MFAAWDNDVEGAVNAVCASFVSYASGGVILPQKSSQIFDEQTQSRINCMPSTVKPLGKAGVKWVSVFPQNPKRLALPNVGGLMVLSEIESGQSVSVTDAASITAIRTAAVDTLAAHYLARQNAQTLAILGTGTQALYHARFMAKMANAVAVKIAGRNASHAESLCKTLCSEGINAVNFGSNMEGAVAEADIVVTATSGQEPILKASWLDNTRGILYCHIGGFEDEYDVAKKADLIVCDSWNALKHRGSPTLARMYKCQLLKDSDIYADLHEIVTGTKKGRTDDRQFIYFNAIGLSFTDVAITDWILTRARELKIGTWFDFSR